MLRAILGVIGGYVVMAVLVLVAMYVAWMIFGSDGAFEAGTFVPSMAWIITSFVVGLIAAIIGGCVCSRIAIGTKPVLVLAAIVFVFGVAIAVLSPLARQVTVGEGGELTIAERQEPKVRTGDENICEAMTEAEQPAWVLYLNPVIGAFGVIIGGRKKMPALAEGGRR